jgi:Domain of unknown function (DUF4397)
MMNMKWFSGGPKLGRLARLVAACALALGLLWLAAPAASASGGVGWVRLAHLSPNTPAVDVYLYSFGDPSAQLVLHHVTYGTVSPFEQVASGEYTVAMRLNGAPASSKPVLSATVHVVSGHAYTVAGMGPASGLRLQVIPDRLTTPRGKALVQVIQASLAQQVVKVTAGSKVLASKLAFAQVTSYKTVSPGTVSVRAVGESESAHADVTLAAGTVHTLVVLDDPGHLQITSLEDAAGSKVMPQGGAATGFGGTAARPGAALLPWGLAALGGVLLAGGGIARLRRRQRRMPMHAK